jgi:class 3 adenylate cyclase
LLDGRPSRLTVSPGQPEIRVTAEQPEAALRLDGERKTVTALFADIKGSMDVMEDLDPEEARAVVDPALELMIHAVRRYDGYIVQSTGDGIFALFGAPVAHEDHPNRALYAALRMQEELRRYSDKLLADSRAPLEVRVGVNTGEVVVRSITTGSGKTEYTPIGHTTNLAARMEALAATGSIAITEHTRRMVEGYFVLNSRGPTKVKGVTGPVNVYEVMGPGPLRTKLDVSRARGFSRFVGRESDIQTLDAAFEQAQAGNGQVVGIVAEAGTGKSRLCFEFSRTLPGARSERVDRPCGRAWQEHSVPADAGGFPRLLRYLRDRLFSGSAREDRRPAFADRRELARVAAGGVRVLRRNRSGASAAADGSRGKAATAFRGAAQGDTGG